MDERRAGSSAPLAVGAAMGPERPHVRSTRQASRGRGHPAPGRSDAPARGGEAGGASLGCAGP
jgi:hypothetical protein